MFNEVITKVKEDDLVKGYWDIPKMKKGVVSCDASSIAIGTVL